MEFLVEIDLAPPTDMPDARWQELLSAEHAAAIELRRQGVIRRFWRLPGTTSNVGLWEAQDATHLHEVISALPLFPWLRVVRVTALAAHPVETGT